MKLLTDLAEYSDLNKSSACSERACVNSVNSVPTEGYAEGVEKTVESEERPRRLQLYYYYY